MAAPWWYSIFNLFMCFSSTLGNVKGQRCSLPLPSNSWLLFIEMLGLIILQFVNKLPNDKINSRGKNNPATCEKVRFLHLWTE